MRILRRVPRSVLWLSFNNETTAREHLEQAAQSYGIEARRLILRRPPLPEQLARYRHADLFLDTLTWNASEAARAGAMGRCAGHFHHGADHSFPSDGQFVDGFGV